MQPIDELKKTYLCPDPWGYKSHPDDAFRKRVLVSVAELHLPHARSYLRCLDIGAGEGWLTQFYPANEQYGFEISDEAAARFPASVIRAAPPEGKYDLVCATGVFYPQYDWKLFYDLCRTHASKHILVSSIEADELPIVDTLGKEIFRAVYPYRQERPFPNRRQRTRMFEVVNP